LRYLYLFYLKYDNIEINQTEIKEKNEQNNNQKVFTSTQRLTNHQIELGLTLQVDLNREHCFF